VEWGSECLAGGLRSVESELTLECGG
jgi:hypothetical protein